MLFALASHSLHVGELEHITLGGGGREEQQG